MVRESAATKARRLLTEGRVTITRVDGAEINALVRGDSAGLYLVQHRPGWWTCLCDAISTLCSHVRAVQLVTVVPGTWIAAPDVMVSIGAAGLSARERSLARMVADPSNPRPERSGGWRMNPRGWQSDGQHPAARPQPWAAARATCGREL